MVITEDKILAVSQAVKDGLSASVKRLPSWLLYDEEGDRIFQRIMNLKEYYPTRCEYEILSRNKKALLDFFNEEGTPFTIIELGAGDGYKTEILLKYFADEEADFKYMPVDVSASVLETLNNRLIHQIPQLSITTICGTYEDALRKVHVLKGERNIFLFLGSNVGNFYVSGAVEFLNTIAKSMSDDDLLLVGFDLKKDPRIIHAAYDDVYGITRDFNLNILRRLNRELGADFNTEKFIHYPFYDPSTGSMKSFLVSTEEQTVHLKLCGFDAYFNQWETIHTEISQKYDLPMIEQVSQHAGLRIKQLFSDRGNLFCDVLFAKQQRTR